MRWEVLYKDKIKDLESVVKVLLKNRKIKDSKDFFNPKKPENISIESLGVKKGEVGKAVQRIKEAKKKKEFTIVYGDYDADGITSSAIIWEALHKFGLDVLPHIPDRFEEGYGINAKSIENLKNKFPNLGLIVTVDNGIVGFEGIEKAKELGIDTIVIDHHAKGEKNPKALSVIHSTEVCGSALAWFFTRQFSKSDDSLELAAIGTIADQMPLVGVNRSIVKYGLGQLAKTERLGIKALLKEAGIEKVGVYEVGYIIAPRINAMGRLKNGMESLRLLCTKSGTRALELAKNVGSTNYERQKIVEDVVFLAKKNVTEQKIIVIAGESYHEGVIGLAAGRLVEEFYRPAIVLSTKGKISKASARSISGFNIIEAIREVNLHIEGGGHPMAAGFSIETGKIAEFIEKINQFADGILTDEILEKRLKIDCELEFNQLNYELLARLSEFEPTGLGNPSAVFATKNVEVIEVKTVGRDARHLKLKLKQDEHTFDSIYFGGGEIYPNLKLGTKINIAYNLEDNSWNGYKNLQLKIKDLNIT